MSITRLYDVWKTLREGTEGTLQHLSHAVGLRQEQVWPRVQVQGLPNLLANTDVNKFL